MSCPAIDELLAGTPPDCDGCRAVLELAAAREQALTCPAAEALLAVRATAALPPGRERALIHHLETCAACYRIARELESPVVAEALADVGADEGDFLELGIVQASNYIRGGEIGRGGMGRIVRARDRRLGRSVAIKELIDERLRGRFENEARLTARLQHPAIVSVHEAGRWPSGAPFYTMKLVAGRPLDQVIAGMPTLAERLGLLANLTTVVEAMAYAHSERVIHRDLKPHNILIGPFGETVVIDWGLAKDLNAPAEDSVPYRGEGGTLTAAGAGTPAYMPPEQARGEAPDERVDVFALGATLHHLLAGSAPGRAPLPDEVPAELAAIVTKATAAAPADRYPTAAELASELRRFQNGQLVAAHRYSARDLARRWLRRNRTVFTMAAASLLALAFVGGVAVTRVYSARARAEASAVEARAALADVLVERGRAELLGGAPARALLFLQAAFERGVDNPALRFMLADAARSTQALIASVPAGDATAIALSPDGRRLAAGGADGSVRVIAVPSGRVEATLVGHTGPITAIAFDETGAVVATASRDGSARLWQAATGAGIVTLPHGSDTVGGVRFRAGRLVTWSAGVAQVWDARGQRLARLAGHERNVSDAELDPTGARVVTVSSDGKVIEWDVATGAALVTIADNKSGVGAAAWDPTGARFATAGWDKRARVFDAATGKELASIDFDESVSEVGFSADGSSLLAHGAWTVKLWDGKETRQLPAGNGVSVARFLPAGHGIVTSGTDGVLRLWERGGEPGQILEGHTGRVTAVAESADGLRLASLGLDGTVKVWDAGASRVLADIATPGGVLGGVFDGAGRILTSDSLGPQLWDAATGRLLATLPEPDAVLREGWYHTASAAAPLADGRVVLWSPDGRTIWDPRTGAIDTLHVSQRTGRWYTYAISPDAGTVAVNSHYGDGIVLRDALTGAVRCTVASRGTHEPFFGRDSRTVGAVDLHAVLHRWDVASGAELPSVTLPPGSYGATFMPGGAAAFVYGDDPDGHLVELATGRELSVFRGHADRILGGQVSDDGTRLLTTSADGTARLWDVARAEPLLVISLPPGSTTVAALRGDGERALVTSWRGSRILDLSLDRRPPAAIAAQIAERVPLALDGARLAPRALAALIAGPEPAPRDLPAAFRPACPPGRRPFGARFPLDQVSGCAGRDEVTMTLVAPSGARLIEVDGAGHWRYFAPDGSLAVTQDREGKDGHVVAYGPDGRKRAESHFNGVSQLRDYTSYYPSGAVHEELRAACGEGGCSGMGTWTERFEDGRKREEGSYSNQFGGWPTDDDVRIGTWTRWDEHGVATETRHGCPKELMMIPARFGGFECK